MKVTRGKIHQYLGMQLDYSVKGKLKISMVDYVKKIVEEFSEEITSKATTPAAGHLFNVCDDAQPLTEKEADEFHTVVARNLFLCKRARPDIQTAVAFLCTRVSKPDKDDWGKLVRLMKYLFGTKDMVLTLSGDATRLIKWWIDVSFAVHKDFKSHTGGTMSMGKGYIYSMSTKQKLNTKSTTESELVGVDDVMPAIIWTNYFLEAQDYKTSGTIAYQDNKSAILLENNGKASSSRRTRHINIRYYFVTDRVKNNELKIEYCGTDDMVGDFFTKPLNGWKFVKFVKEIMNLE